MKISEARFIGETKMKISEAREKIQELVDLQKQKHSNEYIIEYLVSAYASFIGLSTDKWATEHEKSFLDFEINRLKEK
jgi:hypothetical protein